MNATSSSDRYDAARAVLATYEAHDPKTTAIWGKNITGGPEVEPYSLTDTAAEMAAALRALITPPATDQSVEEIADTLFRAHRSQRVEAAENEVRALIATAYLTGIQAAWESWEPESANVPEEGASHAITATEAQARTMELRALRLADAKQQEAEGTLYFDTIEDARVISETVEPDGTYVWAECYLDGEDWGDPAGVTEAHNAEVSA